MTAAISTRGKVVRGAGRKVSTRSTSRQVGRPVPQWLITSGFVVVVLGFFAVAFVHAQLVSSQQELDQTRLQISEAKAEQASIQRNVDAASAPEAIIARASELGMVPAEQASYLTANRATDPTPKPGTDNDVAVGTNRRE